MTLLHRDASPATLAAVRTGVFGLWLVKIAVNPLERLAALPAAFFQPIGVLRVIPASVWQALLSGPGLVALRVATLACLALALIGRWRVPAALASVVLLVGIQGLVRGVGYVNHGELVLLYAAIVLALAPLVDRWARREPAAPPPAERSDVPLVIISAILCFSYTFTGISRLVLGLPAVFHPDTILMWTLMASHQTTDYGWELGRHVLALPPPLRAGLAVGLVAVTVFELLAPCCLISRRFRQAFLLVMVPFHAVVFITMNILFWENLALFLLLFGADLRPAAWRGPPAGTAPARSP